MNRRAEGFSTDFRLADHRITLSTLTKTFGGLVRPIRLAALRLMMISSFIGCSTSRSAGLCFIDAKIPPWLKW